MPYFLSIKTQMPFSFENMEESRWVEILFLTFSQFSVDEVLQKDPEILFLLLSLRALKVQFNSSFRIKEKIFIGSNGRRLYERE